jgi:hypothetical protein
VQDQFKVKFKWSRELMECRKQEKVYFSLKDYAKAEEMKRRGERMEREERKQSEELLSDAVAR